MKKSALLIATASLLVAACGSKQCADGNTQGNAVLPVEGIALSSELKDSMCFVRFRLEERPNRIYVDSMMTSPGSNAEQKCPSITGNARVALWSYTLGENYYPQIDWSDMGMSY